MGVPREHPIEFGEPASIRTEDPVTSTVWEGLEQRAEFPKPGSGTRIASLVKGLLAPDEGLKLLRAAQGLDFRENGASVSSVDLLQAGQYLSGPLASALKPIVDRRLLPYVRHRYNCPGAVVGHASIRRHAPSSSGAVQCDVDRLSYCSAKIALNPEDVRGGVFLQSTLAVDSPGFVPLDCGDMLVHQYDLPYGVRVQDGSWYSLDFHFKDSILACLTNTTPWYDAAAGAGDADAQANLAALQENGNDERGSAAKWYKLAAEQGHPTAQERLGSMYVSGASGLAPDAAQAVHWLHKAALQGRRDAQRSLAELLLQGRGAERNEAEALKWLRRAAGQGDIEAMHLLAIACSDGSPEQAVAWCERGAKAGHPELQHRWAVHLLGSDICQAAHWFRKAAESGHARAQCNLGVFFAQGLGGLPRDLQRAKDYFERSAAAGDSKGRENLARLQEGHAAAKPEGIKAAPAREDAPKSKDSTTAAVQREVAPKRESSGGTAQKRHGKAAAVPSREGVPEQGGSGTLAPSPEGNSVVSMDASQQGRLCKLLSELRAMQGDGASKAVDELVDILQCLDRVSYVEHDESTPGRATSAGKPAESDRVLEEVAADVVAPVEQGRATSADKPAESDRVLEEVAAAVVAPVEQGATPPVNGTPTEAPQQAAAGAPPPAKGTPTEAPPQAAAGPQKAEEEAPPPEAACTRRHVVPRVSARRAKELKSALAAGTPVLVTDAMPHLSGKRVQEFMPKLIRLAGKEQISYEVQGPGGALQLRQAHLAVYMQMVQKGQLLMMSDTILRHAELAEYLVPPTCFGKDCSAQLPPELRPPEGCCLLVGSKGATCQLHRSSATACTWTLLVLGKARWHLLPPNALDSGSCTSPLNTFAEDFVGELWEATQAISEILLVPPGWWSHAQLEDRSFAVSGQQLPEQLLPQAAGQVSLWLGLREDAARSPVEVLRLASEQLGEPARKGLMAAMRSASGPEN